MRKHITKYQYSPDPGEFLTAESVTVPDQTYSIKELVQRYQNGLIGRDIRVVHVDSDIDEINHFHQPNVDLTDVQEAGIRLQAIKKRAEELDVLVKNPPAQKPPVQQ